jgi:hypothetical protein
LTGQSLSIHSQNEPITRTAKGVINILGVTKSQTIVLIAVESGILSSESGISSCGRHFFCLHGAVLFRVLPDAYTLGPRL